MRCPTSLLSGNRGHRGVVVQHGHLRPYGADQSPHQPREASERGPTGELVISLGALDGRGTVYSNMALKKVQYTAT